MEACSLLVNLRKGMQSSSEQPLVGEEHCVTTLITAAKETTDHMVHETKMASEDGAGRDVTEELTQIVRECVRNEIALQRSGSNTSLLMRTRDLIASSARSASREVTLY